VEVAAAQAHLAAELDAHHNQLTVQRKNKSSGDRPRRVRLRDKVAQGHDGPVQTRSGGHARLGVRLPDLRRFDSSGSRELTHSQVDAGRLPFLAAANLEDGWRRNRLGEYPLLFQRH